MKKEAFYNVQVKLTPDFTFVHSTNPTLSVKIGHQFVQIGPREMSKGKAEITLKIGHRFIQIGPQFCTPSEIQF